MIGYARQAAGAAGYGLPLETSALVLDSGESRVVLCGVDVLGMNGPACDALVERVASATGTQPAAVLLNWSHTHLAPQLGELGIPFGYLAEAVRASASAYSHVLQDTIVSVCRLAVERMEPAAIVWGQCATDLAVNRRERTLGSLDGDTILGWNPEELVDNQVTVLQARRADESPIATLVAYGCHPVTASWNVLRYSGDYPAIMRQQIRTTVGGECIFFQGAGGNILPRFAFTDDEIEAQRVGTRLAVAALAAVAERRAFPVQISSYRERSATPYRIYREYPLAPAPIRLAYAQKRVTIPLLPHPELADVERERKEYETSLAAAQDLGEGEWTKVAYYWAAWARTTAAQLRAGTAPTDVSAPIHAVRIGEGAIVTAPGEAFTEYGMAVKERSAAVPTLYAGYTNGLLGYLPTAAEYQFGGYEAGYAHKGVGLPSLFDPSVERICVETGVRLLEQLFPDAQPWDADDGWKASGALPVLPEPPTLRHPDQQTTESSPILSDV